MEILNCEYEKRKLEIKTPVNNLANIVTIIKENFWSFEEELSEFYILENMKLYNEALSNAIKSAGKNAIKNNKRAELIRYIFHQIAPDKTQSLNFCDKEKKKLKINYSCLQSIALIITKLIKGIIQGVDYPQILNEVIDNSNFSRVYDSIIWSTTLIKLKNDFNQVEKISFELSSSYDEEFEIYYIILFYYFYKVFFPKVNSISINLDLLELNKKYMDLTNPYNFNESKIKELCKNYHNICRANFLIACLISLSAKSLNKLKIKATESFVNEINYIIGQEYANKKYNESLVKDKGLILFKKLMKIEEISKLNISINCLDRFLFKETINFIALNRNLESLKLNLFYNHNFFNQRKIYLNYLRGQDYSDIDPNIVDKYGIIYYPYIDKLGEEIGIVIDDEKILDLIFPEFKNNITNLKILLNQYIVTYKEFSLNISPYEELNKCQNYNVQILLFILAILASIETSKEIESLALNCANFEYVNTSLIMENINKLIKPKLINLSKCEKLQKLILNIQGISLFLDFDKLPLKSLTKFEILISNLTDFEKIKTFFENHKNDLIKLEQLNISFPLVDNTNNILNKFYTIFENLPPSLKQLNISNENMLSKEEFLEIINKIQKNNISINCELNCYCFDLGDKAIGDNVDNLKKLLNSKDNIVLDNFEIHHRSFNGFKFNGKNQNFKVILN